MIKKILYEEDFYSWAFLQSNLLREKCFDDLDFLNLAMETDLPDDKFPEHCPFSLPEVMDQDFWPESETY